ncbi:hypothetical protein COCMIDRAFT_27028 [Bipolaris oryzae ATCC 44560]|uniref:Uncharacterized protein n=1 Tax=Bipolaris oryzae ATCC 44560 TaxID=930090 RepID=W6ZB66_COCMI|nr:uncharacterized protein COCMIDRAFT_27028 [Bipolaris oryzae ATCC 44560]EUC44689.1 hypothetical protein COCMIDRAFT_27028 [Bipolaris oryzae ATCC 44560]
MGNHGQAKGKQAQGQLRATSCTKYSLSQEVVPSRRKGKQAGRQAGSEEGPGHNGRGHANIRVESVGMKPWTEGFKLSSAAHATADPWPGDPRRTTSVAAVNVSGLGGPRGETGDGRRGGGMDSVAGQNRLAVSPPESGGAGSVLLHPLSHPPHKTHPREAMCNCFTSPDMCSRLAPKRATYSLGARLARPLPRECIIEPMAKRRRQSMVMLRDHDFCELNIYVPTIGPLSQLLILPLHRCSTNPKAAFVNLKVSDIVLSRPHS